MGDVTSATAWELYERLVKKVPALKYAAALVVLAALGALAASFFSDARTTIPVVLLMMFGMILFYLVIRSISGDSNPRLSRFIQWATAATFVALIGVSFSAATVGWPCTWANLLGFESCRIVGCEAKLSVELEGKSESAGLTCRGLKANTSYHIEFTEVMLDTRRANQTPAGIDVKIAFVGVTQADGNDVRQYLDDPTATRGLRMYGPYRFDTTTTSDGNAYAGIGWEKCVENDPLPDRTFAPCVISTRVTISARND